MMQAVTAFAARASEGSFGRFCAQAAIVFDCVIPIMILIALVTGSFCVVFGIVQ